MTNTNKPSRLRRRLAGLIEDAFKEQFAMDVRVDPDDLHPALGAWRTNWMLDVYRWEGSGKWFLNGEDRDGLTISIDSWVPMTKLVQHGIRHGLSLTRERPTDYEVYEKPIMPRCWRCGYPMQPERPACPASEIGAPCMSEGPPVPPKHRPVASERGYLGSTVDGGIDDHDCGEDTDVESSEPR